MTTTVKTVPFFLHDLGQPELDAIAEVLKGPILTTGATVAAFEEKFAGLLGAKRALGVTSCTGALHISLLAYGIGPGDEVITTPMTFIATATAIMEAGATPVFVDVEPETGNLDATKIEAAITKRTKAIMPVHLYGQMCDMKAIKKIADKHNLRVFEDAAHCVEGERDGLKPGQVGETASFSFYATKNLTCGEGGALVTNDESKFEDLKLLRLHGMTKNAFDRQREGYQHWDMTMLGWKYNMDNIQAAMLLPQFDRIEKNWQRRSEIASIYDQKFEGVKGISRPKTLPGVKHAWHLYPLWVENGQRDRVIKGLQERGIGIVVNYRAIHLLSFFKDKFGFKPGAFPHAERIGDATLSIPFYPGMSEEQIDAVVAAVKAVVG